MNKSLFSDWAGWRLCRHHPSSPPYPIREHLVFILKNTSATVNGSDAKGITPCGQCAASMQLSTGTATVIFCLHSGPSGVRDAYIKLAQATPR